MKIVLTVLITFFFSNCFASGNKNDINLMLERENEESSYQFGKKIKDIDILHINYKREINNRIYAAMSLSFGNGSTHHIYQDSVFTDIIKTSDNYNAFKIGIGFKF